MSDELLAKSGIQAEFVRTSVKGQGVVYRFLHFPKMNIEELSSALLFEAEKYIPFNPQDVVMDHVVIDDHLADAGGGVGMNLLLVAVKKDEVEAIMKPILSVNRKIELIDVNILAALNALEVFHAEDFQKSVGVLELGGEVSTLAISQAKKLRFVRELSFGEKDLSQKLKRGMGYSDDEVKKLFRTFDVPCDPAVAAILQEVLENLVNDLKMSFEYYLDQNASAQAISKLFLCGDIAPMPAIPEFLQKSFDFPVAGFDLLRCVKIGKAVEPQVLNSNQGMLPIILGRALRPV